MGWLERMHFRIALALLWQRSSFFEKSPRPSFLIKRAALGNLKASFHCTHWHRFFPLKKAPPLISVFSPQGRRGKPPSGAQHRYALRLAGHQSPRHGCAGWDRWAVMGISLQLYCWKWVHGGGLQVKPARIVPHCSIVLHLSSLEWGCYLINIVAQYLLVHQHKRMYLIHIPYLQEYKVINHFF